MKIVVYDGETGEPITVTRVPHWKDLNLQEGDYIIAPILHPVSPQYDPQAPIPDYRKSSVRLHFTLIFFDCSKVRSWIAYTSDPESALLLRAAFLPGQSGAVNEERQEAFSKGVVHALESLFGRQ